MDREAGAWATDLFEYDRVYGVRFDLSKEQRVRLVTRPWITRWPLLVWMWLTTVLLPVAGVWRILGAPRLPIRLLYHVR